jgi:hypothetical protein
VQGEKIVMRILPVPARSGRIATCTTAGRACSRRRSEFRQTSHQLLAGQEKGYGGATVLRDTENL